MEVAVVSASEGYKQLTVRLPISVYEKLEKKLRLENKSFNSYINNLILKDLKIGPKESQFSVDHIIENWDFRLLFLKYYGLTEDYNKAIEEKREPKKVILEKWKKLDKNERENWANLIKKLSEKVYGEIAFFDVVMAYNNSDSIAEMSRELGIPYHIVYSRLIPKIKQLSGFERRVLGV